MTESGEKNQYVEKDIGLNIFGRISRPLHKALEISLRNIPSITGESGAIQFLAEVGIQSQLDGNWRTLDDLSNEETKKLTIKIADYVKSKIDCKLHFFGFKISFLKDPAIYQRIFSCDSTAWSYNPVKGGRKFGSYAKQREWLELYLKKITLIRKAHRDQTLLFFS